MFIYLLEGHDPATHGPVTLDACLVAGQKCPAEVRSAFEDRFGCSLIDAYGATETHFVVCDLDPRRSAAVDGRHAGRPSDDSGRA